MELSLNFFVSTTLYGLLIYLKICAAFPSFGNEGIIYDCAYEQAMGNDESSLRSSELEESCESTKDYKEEKNELESLSNSSSDYSNQLEIKEKESALEMHSVDKTVTCKRRIIKHTCVIEELYNCCDDRDIVKKNHGSSLVSASNDGSTEEVACVTSKSEFQEGSESDAYYVNQSDLESNSESCYRSDNQQCSGCCY